MQNKILSFTDLIAWKKGHELVLLIYKVTNNFPQKELFVLTSQIRRAAISITSNIAEGFGRQSYKEKIQFYFISQGSILELQNHIIIAKDLNYITKDEFEKTISISTEVHKIINGLIKGSRLILG